MNYSSSCTFKTRKTSLTNRRFSQKALNARRWIDKCAAIIVDFDSALDLVIDNMRVLKVSAITWIHGGCPRVCGSTWVFRIRSRLIFLAKVTPSFHHRKFHDSGQKIISLSCGFFLLLQLRCASLRPVSIFRCPRKVLINRTLKHYIKFSRFSTALWKFMWKTPC